jgi:hypothetical protein
MAASELPDRPLGPQEHGAPARQDPFFLAVGFNLRF